MNNPNNPFVPKGSLLDLQGRRRSQFKIAVFCVIAVGVVSLSAMLIQGCERKKPAEDSFSTDLAINTNLALNVETNFPPLPTNAIATNVNPPAETNAITPPVEPAGSMAGSEYKIVKGDTLAVIAKKNGVSLKALMAANPKLDPKHLKIGKPVVIPAATAKDSSGAAASASADPNDYVVKHGDTLGHIAKAHGVSVSAIKAANSLTTDSIKVGKHLKIPSKAESAPAPAAPAPMPLVEPAPALTPPPAAPGK